jgi:hypothetical protein
MPSQSAPGPLPFTGGLLASLAPALAVVVFLTALARGAYDVEAAVGLLSGAAFWGWVLMEGKATAHLEGR